MPRNPDKKYRYNLQDHRTNTTTPYYSVQTCLNDLGETITKELVYYHLKRYGVYDIKDFYSLTKI